MSKRNNFKFLCELFFIIRREICMVHEDPDQDPATQFNADPNPQP